jgi:hypothetical protein
MMDRLIEHTEEHDLWACFFILQDAKTSESGGRMTVQ